MAIFPDNINRLLQTLFQRRSRWNRDSEDAQRQESVEQLGASGDVRVVSRLLPLAAVDEALSAVAAGAIARLVRGISPAQFAWLDQQVRWQTDDYVTPEAWNRLSPEAVSRVIQNKEFDPVVIGLIGSHPNGFVRAAVLEYLAGVVDGREIPMLALRANDWVAPVAARASQLLKERLRPENRGTILAMLPFIVRMLGSRRRDHHEFLEALRSVLLSDGGDEAVHQAGGFDTRVRRQLYDMLGTAGDDVESRVVAAALNDPDAVIRARTIRRLASNAAAEGVSSAATAGLVALLERFAREDPVPVVRQSALSSLSARAPERMAAVVPSALLDRAARVRAVARVLVAEHRLAVVPRDFYVQRLTSEAHGLTAVIEGVRETGTQADVSLLTPFLQGLSPRVRRAALRAVAAMDADAAIPHALAALSDEARSVRTMAVRVLEMNAWRVDFEAVSQQLRAAADPGIRSALMRLLRAAPKWDSAAYLLQGLTDPHDEVRTAASTLLDAWLEDFNKSQARPSPLQVLRIRQLLDVVGDRLSTDARKLVRLSIGPL